MTGTDMPVREFVSHIRELAIVDSSRAWLEATFDDGAASVDAHPGSGATLVARAHGGSGALVDGRLTGRWTAVVGGRFADWLLLPARSSTLHHVLVARDRVDVDGRTVRGGLRTAGLADVAADVTVAAADVLPLDRSTPIRAAGVATAAVVGSAQGLWRRHVEQLRSHLAAYHGGTTADSDAAQVARAASDLDAAELQLAHIGSAPEDLERSVWVCRQAVARARSAADRLLEHSRHALDADDPVTRRWCDVDTGARLAHRMFDHMSASLR
ncbi:hypothetical protein FK535_04730 [Mycolicibacterium sp. 018/SC-01/001]|uniref:hypothetical protein n=1 Tax=Mycolicibacterium sp. 018/SC-01/001 TaxID=2592069 RepID=UPI00117EC66F|nr:hypothetical protein [Mycolicibacterium sp. 018/SC-01/001]TRW88489.1 hypothetical protein FK535_04730 [Mycolicibacterium sp. 018/SC-01/001]